jgi:8-oxo-dGTP pyrophosphatase MutT (NUDIX family)
MSNAVAQIAPLLRKPMICEEEVGELACRYGTPIRRAFTIQADEYIRAYRWRTDCDRRAEVVFAIQDVTGRIWLHAKAHYPSHIARLPSGGIGWDETIQGALVREVEEETGLCTEIRRFLGVIEYRFFTCTAAVVPLPYKKVKKFLAFARFCPASCRKLPSTCAT